MGTSRRPELAEPRYGHQFLSATAATEMEYGKNDPRGKRRAGRTKD